VPAQVIDKGIPTAALLAHVLVAKYATINRYTAYKESLSAQALR
jgi:hypothetical protein